MKPPIFASNDLVAFEEHSDVREHTRRDAGRSESGQFTPEAVAKEDALAAAWRRHRPPTERDAFAPELEVAAQPEPESARTRLSAPPLPRAGSLRPPPPPPRPPPLATMSQTGRSPWFIPGVLAAVGLCVVGALALMRMGPAVPDATLAHGMPSSTAAASGESTQVSAARDPVQAKQPPMVVVPRVDCADRALASAVASSDATDEPEAIAQAPSFPRKRSHKGLLLLKSSVPSAAYIDGRFVGNTPLRGFRLKPGKYEVALENAVTDQRTKFSIVAAAGSTIKRSITLSSPGSVP